MMGKATIIGPVVMMSLLMLIASWSIPLGQAADQPATKTQRRPTTDLNTRAANSADDTVKTCLARIPEVATAGQRLLAEQNCRGEERTRQETQVTPRF